MVAMIKKDKDKVLDQQDTRNIPCNFTRLPVYELNEKVYTTLSS